MSEKKNLGHNRKKDFLIDSINSVLISNKNLERSIDKWNYLITHCLSRHYSYPNNLPVRPKPD